MPFKRPESRLQRDLVTSCMFELYSYHRLKRKLERFRAYM